MSNLNSNEDEIDGVEFIEDLTEEDEQMLDAIWNQLLSNESG